MVTIEPSISSTWPQQGAAMPSASRSPSTIRWPTVTRAGLSPRSRRLMSSARSTIKRRIGSPSCCSGSCTTPSSLQRIWVVATTSPLLTVDWSSTCSSVWVEPWLASEMVSRRTSSVSKMVSCSRSIVLARLSGTASTSTVICGVVSKVSRISWVRSNSTPSTLLITSPSLKASRWVAFRPSNGPPLCFTVLNSGR